MFDQVILFVDRYFIWLALAIGIYKVLHIVFYKGLQPRYILNFYFIIFSGVSASGSKNQRQQFRQLHNLLTIAFYFCLVSWAIVHAILNQNLK
ncbi:MAG: hypothetical protein LH478_04645 [Chitinophagaceae bacterium]|nr:hypothetical protein [Chitinophagaceae bacterium]